MNYRVIFNTIGKVALVLSALLVLPLILSACLGDGCWWAFGITILAGAALGFTLMFALKPKSSVFFSKEGVIIVALAWIYVSAIGALPFVISGEIPSYIDAFFETTSGFSTTGATILTGEQIEAMSLSLLFWRSFTHWIGGMGVIVLVMAVMTGVAERGMHILRAEMPGPTVDKIVPSARGTAKILYLIYVGMTLAQIIALILSGMPIFDSIVNSFSTAGTGGFGIRADSIASYGNASQWVIIVFMLLFGVNFNLYYLLLLRRFRAAFGSRELWIYCVLVIMCTAAVAINVTNQLPFTQGASDGIRHAMFQVASFITTTGFSSIPASSSLNELPLLTKGILFVLLFVGGCAGSTAGGLKISRVALLVCAVKKELRRILHPRNANAVKFEGKTVTDEQLHSVTNYFALYMLLIASLFVILSLDNTAGLSIEANLSISVSCINNVGPAFGVASSGCYMYSWLSKLAMSFAMLLGRLEIYPLLLTLSPLTWIKK